ncbi:cytosol aminopeptidase [Halyomorpha halys]|uniref:cytosol aminopeptidase n=1 Tax=Halyomorpha halys TaxID=286706 RepID=UPI0006D4E45E|nr:cytosol aminopeptidase-like [Halyomorpha halys]
MIRHKSLNAVAGAFFIPKRLATFDCPPPGKKGLVLGAYETCEGTLKLTETASKFDNCVCGKLSELLKGSKIPRGKAQVFGGLNDDFSYVAVACLGPESATFHPVEALDQCKEFIREAAGVGARSLQDMGATHIFVEGFTNTEASAEGSLLSVWKYQDWRNKDDQEPAPKIELYDNDDVQWWLKGTIGAESQNMARWISECPSNLMTPTLFCQMAIEYLCPCGVEVELRDREWMEANHFNAFLTMARGSCQPPGFAELKYCGGKENERPVVLMGKGSTFDTGGLNLQPPKGMSIYRGDIAGAACVVSVIKAVARLNLPINIIGVLALYENMPSGLALKHGDVTMSRNGKTIRIEDPANDGRVICADCLAYCARYKPAFIMTVSTSSTGLNNSFGTPPNGLFTTSDVCWEELNMAGAYTGDRVWRLPLWKCFRSRVTNYEGVDVVNTGLGRGGGPCLAAAFLMEFVPAQCDFVLMEVSATGLLHREAGMRYLRKGTMTGRPTRTIIQFLYQLACPHTNKCDC